MGKILKRIGDDRQKDPVEKLRAWLYATIEAETKKDETEIDYELIKECSDLDAFLTGSDSPMSEEEYGKALQQIQSRAAADRGEIAVASTPAQKKKRWSHRAVIAAAAILMVMLSTTAALAISQGLSSSGLLSRKYQYACVEEAADELELDILYPTAMPVDVEIEKIVLSYSGAVSIYEVIFVTNEPNKYRISVKTEAVTDPEHWQNATAYDVNGITFYVLPLSDSEYLAVGHQNGFEYQVSATNMEDLLIILNGMRQAAS